MRRTGHAHGTEEKVNAWEYQGCTVLDRPNSGLIDQTEAGGSFTQESGREGSCAHIKIVSFGEGGSPVGGDWCGTMARPLCSDSDLQGIPPVPKESLCMCTGGGHVYQRTEAPVYRWWAQHHEA